MFQLTQVIEMNEYAAPVTISTQTEWTEGTTFTVSGWGLKHVRMFILLMFFILINLIKIGR